MPKSHLRDHVSDFKLGNLSIEWFGTNPDDVFEFLSFDSVFSEKGSERFRVWVTVRAAVAFA